MNSKIFCLILIIMMINTSLLQGQNINDLKNSRNVLQDSIQSIELVIEQLSNRKKSLELKLKGINQEILLAEMTNNYTITAISRNGDLRLKPSMSGEIISNVVEGDSVIVYDDFTDPYFKVKYDNKVGYLSYAYLDFNDEVKAIISNSKDNKKKEAETKRLQEKEERKEELVEKYGFVAGNKVFLGQVWVGMTIGMLIDSKGYPDDKNTTIVGSSSSEQWIYGENVSSRMYIYVEEGVVTAIQK